MKDRRSRRHTGMEPIDFGPAAQHLAILVTGVDDAQRGAPTPCPAYQVGDLLEHIGTLARAFAAAARKDRGPLTGRPSAGDATRLGAASRGRLPPRPGGPRPGRGRPGAPGPAPPVPRQGFPPPRWSA